MLKKHTDSAKLWQTQFKPIDYNPKLIFKNIDSKKEILFSLSFFLVIMTI